MDLEVAEAKRYMRSTIGKWRDEQPEEWRRQASSAIWAHVVALPEVTDARTLMLYAAIRSEVETVEAIEWVLQQGRRLVLPRVNREAGCIEARLVTNVGQLVRSSFGIMEPSPEAPLVDASDVDVVVVPGLAFDQIGYRLGYGAGYYDRFLANLSPDALAIGVAYAGQVVHRVPRSTADHRLFCLVTEQGVLRQPRRGAPDRTYKGFIFDLDGTVYLGESLIPGAQETIATLRQHAGVVFLSNKPINTREQYAEKLTRLGIPTAPKDVINSSAVMAAYLTDRSPGATVYCVAEAPMIDEMRAAGFRVVEHPSEIGYRVDVVVAAFDRTFDYYKLDNAYQCIKRGADFVATNSDRTCPVEGGEIPDCASMIGAIREATTVAPSIIVGKPHPLTAQAALTRLGLGPDQCLMIGDRVETDMRMGLEAGIETALVLTGVSDEARMVREGVYPHFIMQGISTLQELPW